MPTTKPNQLLNSSAPTTRIRVTLEPELEKRAALWPPAKRRKAASVYARWAKQLRLSAAIMERDEAKPRPSFKALAARHQALN
jgi:hypothetical protein